MYEFVNVVKKTSRDGEPYYTLFWNDQIIRLSQDSNDKFIHSHGGATFYSKKSKLEVVVDNFEFQFNVVSRVKENSKTVKYLLKLQDF